MANVPLAVIILTYNEEVNLPHALDSVTDWAEQVFIVDSYSTDGTLEVAKRYSVPVYQNPWVDWANQRNWAMDNLPIETDWVFFLDADEQIRDGLRKEIESGISFVSHNISAFSVRQAFVFLGRYLKHGHDAPPLVRLVRKGRAVWFCEGAREYCQVEGSIKQLKNCLWHEDHKGISDWIEKQNKNATRETKVLLESNGRIGVNKGQRKNIERPFRAWLRTRIYLRLPGWFRPFFLFVYRYFLRGGFLDGYPGFVFCFLHAFWFPFVINAKVYEAKQKERDSF